MTPRHRPPLRALPTAVLMLLCLLMSNGALRAAVPVDTPSAADALRAAPSETHELEARAAAARLHIAPEPLLEGLNGLDLLYARQYRDAKTLFSSLERAHPDSAIGPLGLVMLAQAQMAENLDFSQEPAFQRAVKEALRRTEAALERGDAPVWNRFLHAGALGMNGIYLYRKDKIVAALQDGWTALNDLETAQQLDPTFVDPALGLGIYNYWRSALTRKYWYLPRFPDRRAEGLRQLELARDRGLFTPTLARLALAFTWLEDGRPQRAIDACEQLRAKHPSNIINLQLLGRLESRVHHFDRARTHYLRVLEADPRNVQVYYYLGNLELYHGSDLLKARTYLSHFVEEKPENAYQALGEVRLGDTCWLLGDRQAAERYWTAARRTDPDQPLVQLRAKGTRPRPRASGPNRVAMDGPAD
jgi:tetratricopeptide (TPR) repeat protein